MHNRFVRTLLYPIFAKLAEKHLVQTLELCNNLFVFAAFEEVIPQFTFLQQFASQHGEEKSSGGKKVFSLRICCDHENFFAALSHAVSV